METAATLMTRLKVAVVERAKHVNAYNEFTASLPPNSVSEWKEMVTAWDVSPSTAPNPYEYRRARESLTDAKTWVRVPVLTIAV